MDEFIFDKLMNIEVPEKYIEKALNVPCEHKRAVIPPRYFRFAAGIAAGVIVAATTVLLMVFGINNSFDFAEPDKIPQPETINGVSVPSTSENSETPSTEAPGTSGADNNSAAEVTEPSENSENDRPLTSDNQGEAPINDSEEKQTDAAEKNTEPIQKPTEKTVPKETQPATAEPESVNPTEPEIQEVYGCRFLTTVEIEEAEGNTYYCKIEDESGNIIGSDDPYSEEKIADIYDWGVPDWPLDVKFTADFVMYYGNYYTVTFYDSKGETVWSGLVFLRQNQSSYLLFEEAEEEY